MPESTLRLVGIAGSLRTGSLNRALLEAALGLVPDGVEIVPFDIAPVPLYNGDLDEDERRPDPVVRLKEAIFRADGVLLVTPEYNYGVPGVLKNTLDWASRPGFRSPMAGKPVGMMGASKGASGTMRGQEQLKLTLLGMGSQVFPHPGVAVSKAQERFDAKGELADSGTRDFVADYLEALSTWIRKVA